MNTNSCKLNDGDGVAGDSPDVQLKYKVYQMRCQNCRSILTCNDIEYFVRVHLKPSCNINVVKVSMYYNDGSKKIRIIPADRLFNTSNSSDKKANAILCIT
jgi:hypothetical protein